MEGEDATRPTLLLNSDSGGNNVGAQGGLQSPSKESGETCVAKEVTESIESKDCETVLAGGVGAGQANDQALSVEEGVVESEMKDHTTKVLTDIGERVVDSGQQDLPVLSTSATPIKADAGDVAGESQQVLPLDDSKDESSVSSILNEGGHREDVGHEGACITLQDARDGTGHAATSPGDPYSPSPENRDVRAESTESSTSGPNTVAQVPHGTSEAPAPVPDGVEPQPILVEKQGPLVATSGVSADESANKKSAPAQESYMVETGLASPMEQKLAEVPEDKAQEDEKEEKVAEASEGKEQKDDIQGADCSEENKLGEGVEEKIEQHDVEGEKSPGDPEESGSTAREGLVMQAEGLLVSEVGTVPETNEKNTSVHDAAEKNGETGEAAVAEEKKETAVEVDDVRQAKEVLEVQGAAADEELPVSSAIPTSNEGDSTVVKEGESVTTSAAVSSVAEAESGLAPLTIAPNNGTENVGSKDGDVVSSASVAVQEAHKAEEEDAAEQGSRVAPGDIPGSPLLYRNVVVETSSTPKVGEIVTLIEKKAEKTSKPRPIPAGKRSKSDDPKKKSSDAKSSSQADSEASYSDTTGDDRSLNPHSGQEVTSAASMRAEEGTQPGVDGCESLGSEEKAALSAQTPKSTEEEATAVLEKGVLNAQAGGNEAAVSCEAAAGSGAASSPGEVPASDNPAASADALKSTEQKGAETTPCTATEAPAEENIKSSSRDESTEKAGEKSPTKRKKLVGRLNLHLPHLPNMLPFMQRHSKQKSQQLQPTDGAAGGAVPASGPVTSEERPAHAGYKRRSMSLPSKFYSFAEGLRGHNRRNSDSQIVVDSPSPSSPPHKKAASQRSFAKIFHRRSQSEASTPRSGLFSGWKTSAVSAFNKLRSRSRSRDVSSMSDIDATKEGSKLSHDGGSLASTVETNEAVPDTGTKQENGHAETTAADHKSGSEGKASADTDKDVAVVGQRRLPDDEAIKSKSEPVVSAVASESECAS
ncbi:hypothetical protein CBR_g2765 [Chara braunii]|uniref:Uncharacterized protein n=1 Tax=Chara braunii TaxID=69332 RepID=A0A388KE43_CHABU|nr:hypothetical protein CBR_g2765 [Chara braunii]|eukprot:GBG68213.1 hypothetical protein CBR_g2765 [Chara braunii]